MFVESTPDKLLLADAASDKLQDPAVIKSHAIRLLAEPEAKAMTAQFATEWLGVADLEKMQKDDPAFSDSLKTALLNEIRLLSIM